MFKDELCVLVSTCHLMTVTLIQFYIVVSMCIPHRVKEIHRHKFKLHFPLWFQRPAINEQWGKNLFPYLHIPSFLPPSLVLCQEDASIWINLLQIIILLQSEETILVMNCSLPGDRFKSRKSCFDIHRSLHIIQFFYFYSSPKALLSHATSMAGFLPVCFPQ